MQLAYRKLVEVSILNDYYLLPGSLTPPVDYSILKDLEILPTRECQKNLRDNKMLFRSTASGFQLFIQVEKDGTEWKSFVPVSQGAKWEFFLRLRNPYWVNFTNIRLKKPTLFPEAKGSVFYFNNLSNAFANNIPYLSRKLPAFKETYPGNIQYQLGDLILDASNQVREAILNDIPALDPFVEVQWANTQLREVHFVNPGDLRATSGFDFTYARANTFPGEKITFSLKDVHNQNVSLGIIPGSTEPQDTYVTPLKAAEPVRHQLLFNGINPGLYTLAINAPSTVELDRTFYLLDHLRDQQVFGVIELFSNPATANYALFNFVAADKTHIKPKAYQIRFKNRMTQWEYLKKDKSVLVTTDYRPLSKFYSRFVFNAKSRPDPDPSTIIPVLDANKNISNIKSIIYLNE